MLGYNTQIQEFPTGTLNSTPFMDTNYHMPFKKNDINFFNKHHKSYNRQIGQIPSQIPHHNVKHNTSVTMNLNNLQNFNPTIGQLYFQEHDTNRTLRHDKHPSKDIEFTNYSYNKIVKEIDDIKNNNNVFHAYKHHSQTLQPIKI